MGFAPLGAHNGTYSCEITLGKDDVKTLYKIKAKFYGSINKRIKTKAYRWRVYKREYIFTVINAINGKLLTDSKHQQLLKMCNNLDIVPIIDNILSKDNGWFSGFFDAKGYFSIRNDYTLILSISQKDSDILYKIQNIFGVGNIYYDKSWNGYNYIVTSKEGIDIFLEYFYNYPLHTMKYVDFITFKRLKLFIDRGYHFKNSNYKYRIDHLILLFNNRKKI